MYARSSTIIAKPDTMDAGISQVRDVVMPQLQDIDGYVGLSMLVNRQTGRCIITTAWRSDDAMADSAGMVRPMRDQVVTAMAGTLDKVEEWEIAVLHRDQPSPQGAWVRATWVQCDRSTMDRMIDIFQHGVLPRAQEFDGFCSASMMINRDSGMSVACIDYASHAAITANREMANAVRAKALADAGAHMVDLDEMELCLAHLHVPEMA